MSFLSDYEKRMLKNREENKKVLASLGLNKPFFPFLHAQSKPATKGIKRKRTEDEKPRKAQRKSADSLQTTRELLQSSEDDWRTKYGRRRSGRLMGKEPGDFKDLDLEVEEEEEDKPKRVPTRNRENVFGPIPDIEVGTTWSTRLACSADGVHRPTVAGIHGNAVEGCYSLALSGGYEDDLDYGDCFTYTGEGGRDLKGTKANPKNLRTAPQSKDQTLTRGNLALTKNIEKGRPVRVIRGYKLDSPFAPEEGYRYDGLYSVEKYWQAVGLSGFMVYKFVLKRCDNQPPAVWHINKEEEEDDNDGSDVHEEEVLENTSPKDGKPESLAEPANSGKDHHSTDKVDENVMMKNGVEKSGAQHTEKNNIDANEIGDKSNSKLEGDEHVGVDDDNHVISTSGQAVGDDANDGDDVIDNGNDNADEHQVTNTTRPQGITEETDVKTKQLQDGRNDVDVDGNLVSTEQGSGEKGVHDEK